jgi:hypothetical protein
LKNSAIDPFGDIDIDEDDDDEDEDDDDDDEEEEDDDDDEDDEDSLLNNSTISWPGYGGAVNVNQRAHRA